MELTRENLESVMHRVAEQTIERDMENEDWEKGTAVNGLVATDDDTFVEAARDIVDRSVATQTAEGKLNYDDPKSWMHGDDPHRAQCEPATMGHGVLEFYDRTGDESYLDAARAQYEYLVEDATRTDDGGIAYSTGPVELWVDSIYMICPFFARYGAITGNERAFDEAVKHIEVQADHLQDPHTGLFRHEWRESPDTYPESSLWARGNGWATAGIVDTLRYLPDDHSGGERLREILTDQTRTLLDKQDESGLWHHILDYRESPLETSATLQFSYAFQRGYEEGVLEDEAYLEAARRALRVAMGVVDEDGRVRRVAVPPGGPDAPLGVTSYGQGWFLMAADRLLSADARDDIAMEV